MYRTGSRVYGACVSNSLRKLLKRALIIVLVYSRCWSSRHRGLIIIEQLTTVDCHYGCGFARAYACASIERSSSTWNNFALYRRVRERAHANVSEGKRWDDAALERLHFLYYDNYVRANLIEIAPDVSTVDVVSFSSIEFAYFPHFTFKFTLRSTLRDIKKKLNRGKWILKKSYSCKIMCKTYSYYYWKKKFKIICEWIFLSYVYDNVNWKNSDRITRQTFDSGIK